MADAIVRAATQAAASNGLPAAREHRTPCRRGSSSMASRIDRRAFVQRSLAGAAGLLSSSGCSLRRAPAIVQAEGSPPGAAAGCRRRRRRSGSLRRLEPLRSAGAHDRRVRDHRSIHRRAAHSAGRPRSKAPTSPRGRCCAICPRASGSSIACSSRTSRTSAVSALPTPGSFVTAPAAAADRDVTLAWSADTVGQGWGINPEWGGLRLYETMRQVEPDVFIHLGDTIYADQPVLAGGQAGRRDGLEEPRDRGEVEGGRDARRVPRRVPVQPDGRAHAPLQR